MFDGLTIEQAFKLVGTLNTDTPRLDIEMLLCKVLDTSATALRTWPDRTLTDAQRQQFLDLLERRKAGEPIAHLIGNRGFWTLDLEVNDSTLIPRPDTECLVEAVLSQFDNTPTRLLDLGTGTGAIALALASERDQWSVVATDASEQAVNLARSNADKHALTHVEFRVGSWFEAVPKESVFDLIVSNPPYIDAQDPHLTQGDVRFEPKSALVADEQGLADLREIASQAQSYLNKGGWIFLEHGNDQANSVQELLSRLDYKNIKSYKDYGGNDRFTAGQFL